MRARHRPLSSYGAGPRAGCRLLYGVVNGVLQGFGIMPFIGMADFTFEYWAEALTRSDLAASVGFSLYIALVSSVVALAGGIVLSAALCAVRRTRLLALIDVQIPLMCAHILVVLAAVSLFSGSGLVPRILYHLGLVSAPPPTSPRWWATRAAGAFSPPMCGRRFPSSRSAQ